jgi:hypothetical protein
MSLTIATKKKILRTKLTKDVKEPATENRKTLMKETEDTCAYGLEELTLLSCPYYTKSSTESMQTLSKSQRHFLWK